MQFKVFTVISALLMAVTAAPVTEDDAATCVQKCWATYFTCVGDNIPEPTCAVGRSTLHSSSFTR